MNSTTRYLTVLFGLGIISLPLADVGALGLRLAMAAEDRSGLDYVGAPLFGVVLALIVAGLLLRSWIQYVRTETTLESEVTRRIDEQEQVLTPPLRILLTGIMALFVAGFFSLSLYVFASV